MKICRYLWGAVLVLSVCVRPAFAEPVYNAFVNVDLVSNIKAIQPGRPFWVGLQMDMDDNWQTYWKNPGDSGLATTIAWDLPEGFKAGEIQWPFPVRLDYPEITSYGYKDKVILMTEITPPENLEIGSQQTVKAHVTWLSCGNMCVPGKADLSLTLPVQAEEPAINLSILQMFDETMNNWPKEASQWTVGAYDDGDSYRLHLIPSAIGAAALTQTAFFPERNDLIDHQAQQVFEKTGNSYRLTIPKSVIAYKNTTQLKGVLVSSEPWEGNRRALAIDEPINFSEGDL